MRRKAPTPPAAPRRAPRTPPARDRNRHPEDSRRYRPYRIRLRRAADQHHAPQGDPAGPHVVDGVRQRAEHGLDGCPRQVLLRGVRGSQPAQHPVRRRPVRRALAVEIGQQGQPARPGRGREREVGKTRGGGPEQPRGDREHPRRVDGRDQRQEPSRRVGEPGDGARRVGRRLGRDRVRGARGADRYDHVVVGEAESERRAHVVPGAGRERRAPRGLPDDLGGRRDARQGNRAAERPRRVVRQPGAVGGGEVAGARRVAPVGGRLAARAAQAPGQPVVRKQHAMHAPRVVRLAFGQPAQLGDGERHGGDAAGARGPFGGPAELGYQVAGLRRGLDVVPQHGGPDHLTRVVEHDHAVLLRRDADRRRLAEQAAARRAEGVPPVPRVALGAVRMRRGGLRDLRAIVGSAEQDFRGLCGGINPGDQLHERDSSSLRMGSH